MQNLVRRIPRNLQIALMVAAVVAVVLLSLQMDSSMAPAIDDSEFGIVSFEFATTADRAIEILDSWGADGRDGADSAIKLDYVFLVAYSLLLVLTTASVAMAAESREWTKAKRIGFAIAGLVPVAGVADAVENTALLSTIRAFDTGDISSTATSVAAGAAGLKFAILAAAIIYILAVIVTMEYVRVRTSKG